MDHEDVEPLLDQLEEALVRDLLDVEVEEVRQGDQEEELVLVLPLVFEELLVLVQPQNL